MAHAKHVLQQKQAVKQKCYIRNIDFIQVVKIAILISFYSANISLKEWPAFLLSSFQIPFFTYLWLCSKHLIKCIKERLESPLNILKQAVPVVIQQHPRIHIYLFKSMKTAVTQH